LNLNLITLSHATYVGPSGATGAATYQFFTKEYKPPSESRAIDKDEVVNQNGKFRYIYDNGPGFKQWSPFTFKLDKQFEAILNATVAQQYAHLREMWEHRGVLGMQTPDGVHTVAWGGDLERNFVVFPVDAGASQIEYEVVVQFEEAS
jgi:hypothetical protein